MAGKEASSRQLEQLGVVLFVGGVSAVRWLVVVLVGDVRPDVLHLEVLEVVEVVDHVAVEAARVRVPGVARLHLPALRRAQDGLHVSRIHVRVDLVVQEARDLVGDSAREHAGQPLGEVLQLLGGQTTNIVTQLLEGVVCFDGVAQQLPHDLVEAVAADAVGDDFAGRFLHVHASEVVLLVHVQLVDGLARTLVGQETDDRDGFAGRRIQHTDVVVGVAHAGGVVVAHGDRAVTGQVRADVVDVVDGHFES